MKPRIDQFYLDPRFGRIKAAGEEGDAYLFHGYETLSKGRILESRYAYKINRDEFSKRVELGLIQPSVPPQ